jgi:hypothetical protein
MTKYLSLILCALCFSFGASANDFEAELRLLEHSELVQDAKEDSLVEQIAVVDSVSEQSAAPLKETTLNNSIAPISQELSTPKKIRRVPSR